MSNLNVTTSSATPESTLMPLMRCLSLAPGDEVPGVYEERNRQHNIRWQEMEEKERQEKELEKTMRELARRMARIVPDFGKPK